MILDNYLITNNSIKFIYTNVKSIKNAYYLTDSVSIISSIHPINDNFITKKCNSSVFCIGIVIDNNNYLYALYTNKIEKYDSTGKSIQFDFPINPKYPMDITMNYSKDVIFILDNNRVFKYKRNGEPIKMKSQISINKNYKDLKILLDKNDNIYISYTDQFKYTIIKYDKDGFVNIQFNKITIDKIYSFFVTDYIYILKYSSVDYYDINGNKILDNLLTINSNEELYPERIIIDSEIYIITRNRNFQIILLKYMIDGTLISDNFLDFEFDMNNKIAFTIDKLKNIYISNIVYNDTNENSEDNEMVELKIGKISQIFEFDNINFYDKIEIYSFSSSTKLENIINFDTKTFNTYIGAESNFEMIKNKIKNFILLEKDILKKNFLEINETSVNQFHYSNKLFDINKIQLQMKEPNTNLFPEIKMLTYVDSKQKRKINTNSLNEIIESNNDFEIDILNQLSKSRETFTLTNSLFNKEIPKKYKNNKKILLENNSLMQNILKSKKLYTSFSKFENSVVSFILKNNIYTRNIDQTIILQNQNQNQTTFHLQNLSLNTIPTKTTQQMNPYKCYNQPINIPIIFLFNSPHSIVTDRIGNIYVANVNEIVKTTLYGNRFQVLTYGFIDTITNIAVNYQGTYLYIANVSKLWRINTDGTNLILLNNTPFDNLYGIAVDSQGFVYATTINQILKMDSNGNILNIITNGNFYSLYNIGVSNNNIYVVSNYYDLSNNVTKFYNKILKINKQSYAISPNPVLTNLTNIIGLSVNTSDILFISDTSNNNIIKSDSFGNILYTYNDLSLNTPYGLTTDLNNNIYIADTNNNQIKKIYNNDTQFVPFTYEFNAPSGIATDIMGNLYITDLQETKLIFINILTGEQKFIQSQTPLNNPSGLAIDNINQLIYVADTNNGIVQKMNLDGSSSLNLGQGILKLPTAVAVDNQGLLYVTDISSVYVIGPNLQTPVLIPTGISFINPTGIAIDNNNYLYIADTTKTQIIRMTNTGTNPVALGYGFNTPNSVTVNKNGYIFVTDSLNNRVVQMDSNGNNLTFISDGINFPYSIIADNIFDYVYVITAFTILKLRFSEPIPCPTPPDFNDVIARYCYKKTCEAILYKKLVTANNNPLITKNQQYAINIRTYKKIPVSYQTLIANLNCNRPPVVNPPIFLFNNPRSIASDTVGSIYVSNLDEIVKISWDGTNKKSIASGFDNTLTNIAVNFSGTYLYITVVSYIVRINTDGTNRINLPQVFDHLYGIAVDGNGLIYVTDIKTIKIMDENGENLIFARNDNFLSLYAISVFQNNIYVISTYIDDTNNTTKFYNELIKINMTNFIPDQNNIVNIPDSSLTTIRNQLSNVIGLSVYSNNIIYLSNPLNNAYDLSNNTQSQFNNTVFKIDGNGNLLYNYNVDFSFNSPYDVTVDINGNLYVANTNDNVILKIFPDINTHKFIDYAFYEPIALAVDNNENIYIIDLNLTNITIISVNKKQSYIGSNLNNPSGIAIDIINKYVYVTNTNNGYVERINFDGTNQTIIGSGYFVSPFAIAVDSYGTIYVSDTTLIKKIDTNGILTVLPYQFENILGIAVDTKGYIYVAEINQTSILKLDKNGINAVNIGSGFSNPYDVAVDNYGYLYVADSQNNRIVRMDTNGNGMVFFTEGIKIPYSVAVDDKQNVYAVTSNRIIKFRFATQAICA